MDYAGGEVSRKQVLVGIGLLFCVAAIITTIVLFTRKRAAAGGASPAAPSSPTTSTAGSGAATGAPAPAQAPAPAAPPAFSLQKPFRIMQVRGGYNKCLSDNGAVGNGDRAFGLANCDPTSPDQQFVYDPLTMSVYNLNKPDLTFTGVRVPTSSAGYLCMDDNNTTKDAAGLKMQYWSCKDSNPNQKWMFVEDTAPDGTKVYRIVNKPKNRCLDLGNKSWSCLGKSSEYYPNQIYTLSNL